jgi:hypothetical protein
MRLSQTENQPEPIHQRQAQIPKFHRLRMLNARVKGRFTDFMTQKDLSLLRALDLPKDQA